VASYPRITPAEPAILLTSPPGEKRWGFYQFPDMWRAPGGEIYCAVNVGHDCLIGQHEPSQFYRSDDNGGTWRQVPYGEVDQSPDIVEFSDGSQVSFGKSHYIYHVQSYGPYMQKWHWLELAGDGAKPVSGLIFDAYDNQEWVLYRYDDLPAAMKQVPIASRRSKADRWQEVLSTVDLSGLYTGCVARAWWWDEKGNHIYEDLPHRLQRPWPRWGVTVLPDDTLLWPHCVPNPIAMARKRVYWSLALFASTDRGRSWHKRAMIADDVELTTDGYSGDEHSLAVMPNGDLVCVMRTVLGDRPGCTMYLAAARSTDRGFTWTRPSEIAPFSVTPILMTLANGSVAAVYGRPGVYVRVSGDSGRTWSEALPVVGPPEATLLADRWWDVRYDDHSGNKISCGNLSAVVTGPNRFLLAYSDFRYPAQGGETCKAVMVREFLVG